MVEFEIKDITAYDYLHVRDLMTEERHAVWDQLEREDFSNDYLGELVEAYDFVIDTLTCLAIELSREQN